MSEAIETRSPQKGRSSYFDQMLRQLKREAEHGFAQATEERDGEARCRWRIVLWKLDDLRVILNEL